ncbi:MAG: hypothetical protein K2L18_10220, partial [Acetatifactor sp.]|nr:hypothetical protein [Acetatifactor sp.]
YQTIHDITMIDVWFIAKLAVMVEMEQALEKVRGQGQEQTQEQARWQGQEQTLEQAHGREQMQEQEQMKTPEQIHGREKAQFLGQVHQECRELTMELLREAKRLEFPDQVIARLTGMPEAQIKQMRYDNGIVAVYKMVDTCAAEFAAATPYYYSVFGGENEATAGQGRKKVLVLGSGPIRIGQGIEFDYCSVHATWAFSRAGYETIIINNNPETVSTDFDIADKLYFEPLTPEDVESIVNIEKPDGAVVQFGGQTAIKLTESLMKMGVPILGTQAEDVDAAEDRELFDKILEETEIPRAAGGTVYTAEEAMAVANRLGYPVLVRPSYVLGGQGMQIAISDQEIEELIEIINRIAQYNTILVDK